MSRANNSPLALAASLIGAAVLLLTANALLVGAFLLLMSGLAP